MQINKIIKEYSNFFQENEKYSEIKNLQDPIKYCLENSGKKLRPILLLLITKSLNQNINKAIQLGFSLEYFHNFTLIHDDIMDNSNIRRGKETIHKKWDNNIAILSGDYLLLKAFEKLNKYYSGELLSKILEEFTYTALRVCEGQQMDLDLEGKECNFKEYIDMIYNKTGCLIKSCFKLGGILSNVGEETLKHLETIGKNIGIAFQIQDDFLDLFGNTKETGKKIGGDLIQNKNSIIRIICIENNIRINKEFKNENDILLFRDLLNKNGIKDKIILIFNNYFNLALENCEKIKLQGYNFDDLINFLKELKNREN